MKTLAKKLAREHELAISALGRSYRAGTATRTSEKHREDFERHQEKFDAIIKELSTLNT